MRDVGPPKSIEPVIILLATDEEVVLGRSPNTAAGLFAPMVSVNGNVACVNVIAPVFMSKDAVIDTAVNWVVSSVASPAPVR